MGRSQRAHWIDLGDLLPTEFHAYCLAMAEVRTREDPPAVLWARSQLPQLCVGAGQSAFAEADMAACRRRGIQVVRRCLGGGTVLVDARQWCFVAFVPAGNGAVDRHVLLATVMEAAAATFRAYGITCHPVPPGDLWADGRKILGSGGATVGDTHLLGASFLIDFDRAMFAELVRVPSESFREWLREELETGMTCWSEHAARPLGGDLGGSLREHLERAGGWLFASVEARLPGAALEDARAELAMESENEGGRRRVPHGIKVNQGRFLVEFAPVRAVLNGRHIWRLALEGAEVELDGGIDYRWSAFEHRIADTPYRARAADLWFALDVAATGAKESQA